MIPEWLLQIVWTPMRIRHWWTNRGRLAQSEELKTVLLTRLEHFSRARLPAYEGILNFGLFITLAVQDISAFSESIIYARSDWERRFHARYLAVLLYELIEDLSGSMGGEYRGWLIDVGCDQSWIERLNTINGKVTNFGKHNAAWLREIRKYAGAHRDHNAREQIRVMASFGWRDVEIRAAALSEPMRELMEFYTDLLELIRKRLTMGAWLNAQKSQPGAEKSE